VFDHDAHARPPTLTDRLQGLNENLRDLAMRLRDAIAQAVSRAVARAVRDLVRRLLDREGRLVREIDSDSGSRATDESARLPPPDRTSCAGRSWKDAFRCAAQAALCCLRTRPTRRSVLATALVALVAGGTVLVAGPTFGHFVGVVASVASLVLTAESVRAAVELVSLATG
jgi:hypothetical protein